MKRNLFLLIVIFAFTVISCQQNKKVVVTNPTDQNRPDEVLVLGRQAIESSFPGTDSALVPAIKNGGEFVPSQADDLNGDGLWDELAFLVNLGPKEELQLDLVFVPSEAFPEFEKRTNVRLGIEQADHSFVEVDQYAALNCRDSFRIIAQGESVNWENDKMGFRNYFDCRNVKDLFGKLQPGLIVDKIHTPEMGDYHTLADWGMDVLHCGNSLGAGGIAVLENDSLYRLGSTETYEYQKIAEGPVRSVFDLKYTGWQVAGENLAAVERISVYPGKYWFQSDVTVSGFAGQKQVVTGIVTSKLQNEPYHFKANDEYEVIATLDRQSLNDDTLGMAVMLRADEVTKVARTTNLNFFNLGYPTVPAKNFSQVISETYYVAQKAENDVPARHYFFAVWGLENPAWNDPGNYKKYLADEADKLSNPLFITIQ
ncbi:MAG: DUF4861 domain-containing protein [Prolixibacteraceae bacterium]